MEEQILAEIAAMLKKSLVTQLQIPRPVRTYAGQQKTVNGRPVPPSPPVASGNLLRNINVYWVDSDFESNPELIVEMPDYYYFVEQGRRPGRYPPLNVIRNWARVKKSVPQFRDKKGRFISNESRAFLIARSIATYGFGATPFIDNAVNSVLPQITEKLGEAAAAFLENTINNNRIIVG
jgi:hypothetical protein